MISKWAKFPTRASPAPSRTSVAFSMTRTHRLIFRILSCVILLAVVFWSFSYIFAPGPGGIEITLVSHSCSSSGTNATLRLTNYGASAVAIDEFCTIYWTNQERIATNVFFKHTSAPDVLKPSHSIDIIVPSPPNSDIWQTSFSYSAVPSWSHRAIDEVKLFLSLHAKPDNTFSVRLGPLVTNSLPAGHLKSVADQPNNIPSNRKQ
jgi:hypothetical protein